MRIKNLVPFKSKILQPCKKVLRFFRFRLRKPVFIRALHFRNGKLKSTKNSTPNRRLPKILTMFRSLRQKRDMDRVTELKSFSDSVHQKAPYPSPLTPAYIRMSAVAREEVLDQNEVEDACRSFENYLIDMIVEEGRMRDLVDVEELLYSWKNLKSPVFIDLVCRFYGELCKDLFSNSSDNDTRTPKGLIG